MKLSQKLGVVVITGISLAACATSGQDQKAEAPFHSLAVWAGVATNPAPSADFVVASRPKEKLEYLPVGVTPAAPKANAKKLTPEELKALEDNLEATRLKNAAAAGVSP
jgi:hypothetical protein